jgi:hypothetical protein
MRNNSKDMLAAHFVISPVVEIEPFTATAKTASAFYAAHREPVP